MLYYTVIILLLCSFVCVRSVSRKVYGKEEERFIIRDYFSNSQGRSRLNLCALSTFVLNKSGSFLVMLHAAGPTVASCTGALNLPQPQTKLQSCRQAYNVRSLIILRAKLSGAVYCYRTCLWRAVFVCGPVTTITRNFVHQSSSNWVCR